ncbi:hypothetical protein C1N53_08255 [Pontibacter sp. SGAir0037]|nr:hypothetical protein C1N53_08255 [Pontibacter sp. SGAir0037]
MSTRSVKLRCFTGDFIQAAQRQLGRIRGFHIGKESGSQALNSSFSGYRNPQCTQTRPAEPPARWQIGGGKAISVFIVFLNLLNKGLQSKVITTMLVV